MVYAVWCLLFGVYMTSADHSLAMKPWYNTIPLPFCGSLLTIAICLLFPTKGQLCMTFHQQLATMYLLQLHIGYYIQVFKGALPPKRKIYLKNICIYLEPK